MVRDTEDSGEVHVKTPRAPHGTRSDRHASAFIAHINDAAAYHLASEMAPNAFTSPARLGVWTPFFSSAKSPPDPASATKFFSFLPLPDSWRASPPGSGRLKKKKIHLACVIFAPSPSSHLARRLDDP